MRHNDVLEFDISMNDIFFMHIIDSFNDLPRDYGGRLFTKIFIRLQKLKEMSIASQFQKKINVLFISKEVIKLDKIRMLHIRLKLNLSDELLYRF